MQDYGRERMINFMLQEQHAKLFDGRFENEIRPNFIVFLVFFIYRKTFRAGAEICIATYCLSTYLVSTFPKSREGM